MPTHRRRRPRPPTGRQRPCSQTSSNAGSRSGGGARGGPRGTRRPTRRGRKHGVRRGWWGDERPKRECQSPLPREAEARKGGGVVQGRGTAGDGGAVGGKKRRQHRGIGGVRKIRRGEKNKQQ
ncbi:hypothetical protein BU14_0051s0038 [Porphyra umbilicalis]|uniref:Uncharacterized protein n=1 Tax=Porphyra umbilicalis TaxID=2786 RepID=A0A1X6PIJ7_PORUM|nr:hypothetical protein BU14_0051s0038 [Porphyra umbilicalis]|eukprot:OSX80518.1 hypothetical protein BU14_0051s0038 [Porphyra umbilicalis]